MAYASIAFHRAPSTPRVPRIGPSARTPKARSPSGAKANPRKSRRWCASCAVPAAALSPARRSTSAAARSCSPELFSLDLRPADDVRPLPRFFRHQLAELRRARLLNLDALRLELGQEVGTVERSHDLRVHRFDRVGRSLE